MAADGNARWWNHLGNRLNTELPSDPTIFLLGINSRGMKIHALPKIYKPIFIASLVTVSKISKETA